MFCLLIITSLFTKRIGVPHCRSVISLRIRGRSNTLQAYLIAKGVRPTFQFCSDESMCVLDDASVWWYFTFIVLGALILSGTFYYFWKLFAEGAVTARWEMSTTEQLWSQMSLYAFVQRQVQATVQVSAKYAERFKSHRVKAIYSIE